MSCVLGQTAAAFIPAWVLWLGAFLIFAYVCSARVRRGVRTARIVAVQGGSLVFLLVRVKLGLLPQPAARPPPPVIMKRPAAPPLKRVQASAVAVTKAVPEPEQHVSQLLENVQLQPVFFSAHEFETNKNE